MDWTQEIKNDLRSYAARKAGLQNTSDELERLETEFYGLKSSATDSTPVSGGSTNSWDNRLLNNIVRRGKLEGARRSTSEWVKIMDRALAQLSAEEFDLLDRLYIHGSRGSADRLAEELNIEVRTVWRQSRSALEHLAYAMYGQLTS